MAGNDHRRVVKTFCQQVEEYLARFRIKIGGRLVHDQHIGIATECNGDQQLLFHAAGEADKLAGENAFDIQPEALGNGVDTLRVGTAQRRREPDKLSDRHFQRRRQLRHKPDVAKYCRPVLTRVQPVDGNRAVKGVFAQQAANQCCLAGAVRTDQRDTLANTDIEADTVKNTGPTKTFGKIGELDHWAIRGERTIHCDQPSEQLGKPLDFET